MFGIDLDFINTLQNIDKKSITSELIFIGLLHFVGLISFF
ncbi:hypothetical protein SAMN04489724_2016 [Algoriphagus locisalis]|uniref:Uncharacterized protein n=1 Tax=Algoriphagus locisalis TaxID=305507 RepID=A0A1I7AJH9_9BACT|nr:hypothetical protein SAMN04489724_2016 [Algoriphagus locisalis]